MVGWKKFLLIPLFIVVYLYFLSTVTGSSIVSGDFASLIGGQGNSVIIGVGDGVGVSVTRPYFFGLVTLPVYSPYFGDISGFNNAFFVFIILLTAFLIYWEWRKAKAPPDSLKRDDKRRGTGMAEYQIGSVNQPKLVRSIEVGLALGLVCFILTGLGDWSATMVVAILATYLEYNQNPPKAAGSAKA
jgi:hypothetical protein